MDTADTLEIGAEQVWAWLKDVSDPEIPVISVVDLGIVRNVTVGVAGPASCTVTITPTYSGCPAMEVIAQDITSMLRQHGLQQVTIETRLSPAWTTDWMSDTGRDNLKGYGIAPPAQQVVDISGILRRSSAEPAVDCPNCGSAHTRLVSQFGSTACKALYRCNDCLEPFDYFKCH